MKKLFVGLLTLSCLSLTEAAVICQKNFADAADLRGIYNVDQTTVKIVPTADGIPALEIAVPDQLNPPKNQLSIHLPGNTISGRQLVFEIEISKDLDPAIKQWGGGLFAVWGPAPEGAPKSQFIWKNQYIGTGKVPWKKYRMVVDFPDKMSHALLSFGISDARGKIFFRNLKITSTATHLDLTQATNMGFADARAGDHQGGWHDQGIDHDASAFPVKKRDFANVPFTIIDPKANHDKAIIVFQCPKLPNGPSEATVIPPVNTTGKYLYLLHCSAWGQQPDTETGKIILTNREGKTAVIPVIYGHDLTEWWGAKAAPNAVIGVQIAAKAGAGAAYVSRFELPDDFGPIAKITFQKQSGANTMWMLIAASVSDIKFQYPENQALVIKEDAVWKALPQQFIQAPKAGTALDFSGLYPRHEVGQNGRVVINSNGHFEFGQRPGEPVRFFSLGMGRDFGNYFKVPMEMKDKEMIERYADQIQRAGYNMVRFWAEMLKNDGDGNGKEGWRHNKAFEFSPSVWDRTDYFLACLRKRGIYVLLSIGMPTIGIDYCNPWGDKRLKDHSLYRNQTDRQAWQRGVEKVLTHVNPYTGMRWIDDPQIAMIDCNNEMEFAFIRADDRFAGLFREFLKQKYGDFTKLKKAWGKDAQALSSFDDITTFKPLGQDMPGQLCQDRAEFVTQQETTLYKEEKTFLRHLGYPGPVTSFLMGKSMRHVGVRKDFDFVAMNGYHTHPSGDVVKHGAVDQISSIESAANIIRSFLAARLYGKPFLVTEHCHTFWNKYRYEQGFIMGGFSSLNDFDGLTAFFMQITTHPNNRITSFEIRHDPVLRASELMTGLMLRRGDVQPAKLVTRIPMNLDEVIAANAVTDSISSAQLRMGLIGQCYVDLTHLPLKPNEFMLSRSGSSGTAVRRADSNVVDAPNRSFNLDEVVKQLKARNLLPSANRTSAEREIYQSDTGEIFLDCTGKFMSIAAPRFQGVCGPAGTSAKLKNIEINGMNRNACIALAAIDGRKEIAEASRLLLFVVTNVLNSNMRFESADQRVRIDAGTTPLLLETGKFNLVINHPKANKLKAYALAFDGTRLAELPLTRNGNRVELKLDTAQIPQTPTCYFELIAE